MPDEFRYFLTDGKAKRGRCL